MGNHHHEDERYKKFYDRTPHGEVPADERVRRAREGGADPVEADEQAPSPEPSGEAKP